MWDKGNSSQAKKGVKYIKEHTQFDWNTEHSDLYAHYYESQAMMQAGGENWKFYNELFRDQMLSNQNADGTWKVPGHAAHNIGNPVYRTALCTLMLEVYYRFLNSTGGGIQRKARSI
jgi:hypothetical protein